MNNYEKHVREKVQDDLNSLLYYFDNLSYGDVLELFRVMKKLEIFKNDK